MAGNGRFYVELSVTVYADSDDEADAIAKKVEAAILNNTDRDDVGAVMISDIDREPLSEA